MNCKNKSCTNPANDSKICPQCCKAMYCSDECLKSDRDSHKSSCTPPVFILKDFIPIKNSKSLLGKGAYGEVQLVQHVRSKFLYALKMIRKSSLSYHNPIEIFLREISVHKSLIHPNITRLYDHLEDRHGIYLILEYVEKGNLYGLLKKKIRLQEPEACEIFKQACVGVGFLHNNNIIHRDIKSENLLISRDDIIKLCDFGWCAIGLEPRATFCGTADYMAPEMSQSESYNYKVDIWALGILLYELLHGRPPFISSSLFDKFSEINDGTLSFRSDLSDNARNLILKILTPDPASRPTIKDILKSHWFSEHVSCKLRVGNTVKHPELGEGTVINTEGNVCGIEFAKQTTEMIDTEVLRICEIKNVRAVVTRSQEFRNKPPLAKSGLDKSPMITISKVTSAKELRKRSPGMRRGTVMNTSVEGLCPKYSKKRNSVLERSFDVLNNLSESPVKNRRSPSPNYS